ncbi:phosphoglucomutase/phosphomannomutase PgmG [Gluconobacter wancherniae]|uniref:Phosphomannomutase n=1 Tax=Gluconobacter wancherniae NBRC 103581 TaxID=656744 RepID=A0A511AZ10_9PROT|nr:phosphomannomutase/phosphoglucomutase [Gluconobacter wancherniae]MBF0853602.1 phosphomannomutase/phosphoglucomutase [Gluconobacter wancherniae]GBD55652.1 phosphomannomutase [Gluconobacter wancherniae NBRC 103581]GBR66358.1 phosphomannomutase [Gluconobacter wancherniae NBRC 103581]GEK93444.1 phosphomannomutase [Gluconobacter wancherniae NBRC 103581]
MSFEHGFEPTSLREYDIRGVVGKTLSSKDAFAIGRTFASLVLRSGGRRVVVGYDGRLSSPELEAALVSGAVQSGAEVVRIGCGPTPMLYFASIVTAADGAIMVTGSHNPPEYNGFKMMLGGKPFYGDQIRELGRLAAIGDVVPEAVGSSELIDISGDYVDRLLQDYDGSRPLRVVWDNGNSAAGDVLSRLVCKLPGEHTVLFGEVDGSFPNHHPDPTVPTNLEALIAEVKTQGADLGIAFDGDADRIGIVDDKGQIFWGDQILILLARDVLKSRPGATIIADVKTSQMVFDEIGRAGGMPLMWRTGHSLIKSKMVETGAPLAGEMSGHIFFADKWFGFDDALYAAIRVLGIVSRLSGSLSQMRDALPQMVNTPELRFDCADTRKFEVIEEVAGRLEKVRADVSKIDGVRVNTVDGWWLLRASNTQAVLVARAESRTEEGLERLKFALASQLQESGLATPDFSGENAGH